MSTTEKRLGPNPSAKAVAPLVDRINALPTTSFTQEPSLWKSSVLAVAEEFDAEIQRLRSKVERMEAAGDVMRAFLDRGSIDKFCGTRVLADNWTSAKTDQP